MNLLQKLIKGFAIGLAVFLVVALAGVVLSAVGTLELISNGFERDNPLLGETVKLTEGNDETSTVKKLDVNVKATRVVVKTAEAGVKYQTNNEYIDVWESDGAIHVVERSHGVLGLGGVGELTIYIGSGMELEEAKFEVGAGTLEIQELVAKRVSLKLGAGKTEIADLKVSEKLQIDGGAGLLTIKSGKAKDAEIEIGAGKAQIRLELVGTAKLESGVGKLELGLIGAEADYQLKVEKGIGKVEYNGRSLADGAREGEGSCRVEIKAGVGAVEIQTIGH